MNRQVTTSDRNNAGTGKHRISLLHHQVAGKRKAESTMTYRQGNVNFPVSTVQDRNKDYLKSAAHHGHQSAREYSRQDFSERPAFREITEQRMSPVTISSYRTIQAPSVQNSPMVVGNLSLEGQYRDREFLLPEYSQESYAYLKELEVRLRPRVNYMKQQPHITSPMRRILVVWLVEVCKACKLDQETLYLAVSYVDKFLSCMAVHGAQLQLIGIACLLIAAKYEEIYPPEVSDFVYITGDVYTKQHVLCMEHLVLKVLAFDLSVPTANRFLLRFCSLCKVPAPIEYLARYLCELSLLEADPFLNYLPSQSACAALALANYTMGKEMWTSEMQLVTGYAEEDFRGCLESLHMLYLHALNSQLPSTSCS